MDRIDYRKDRSKPMPKKEEAESIEGKGAVRLWPETFTRAPSRMVPGLIVNIYDVSTKAFIGPGLLAGPALSESGVVAVICFPAVDWRNFDDEIVVGTKVKQAGAVSHITDAMEGDDWVWAWPQEWEQFAKEGWR